MGRTLQNKKRRSKAPKVRQSNKPKKQLNPLGNSTIAKNWNKDETMTQNYRRLGLVARLQAPTGGREKSLHRKFKSAHPLDIKAATAPEAILVSEARVERDADGKIVRVVHGKSTRPNPLNDPLNGLDSESEGDDNGDADMNGGEDEEEEEEWEGIDGGEKTEPEVVKLLENEASVPQVKKERWQSDGEVRWLEALVERHGGNVKAMVRDRKLNPMQQTEADIGKRLRRWKKSQGLL